VGRVHGVAPVPPQHLGDRGQWEERLEEAALPLLAQVFNLSAAMIAGGAITFASGLLAARWITGGPSSVLPPRRLHPRIAVAVRGTGSR